MSLEILTRPPNNELPRPVSWIGKYDKSAMPSSARVGLEMMAIHLMRCQGFPQLFSLLDNGDTWHNRCMFNY